MISKKLQLSYYTIVELCHGHGNVVCRVTCDSLNCERKLKNQDTDNIPQIIVI